MSNAFSIKFDASGLDAALDQLEVGVKEQIRPAAQSGAQVLYEEVLARVPVSKTSRKTKDGRTIAPGALRAAIYQVFSKDNSTADRATYHVSWNYRKAPHGQLVEFGTSRSPAHPFLRPAHDTKAQAALIAAKAKWEEGAKQVIAGLKS